ncbi:MAG: Hpt domain-containing protein [Rhodospirillales bacterium]
MTEGDSAKDDVEIIKPPNVIKSKVTEGGPGAVDEETLKRAEAVISKEANNYFQLVKEDLSKLRRSMSALKADPAEPQPALGEIFSVTHTIKGQAGSFGYDLLTQIADRLCRVIEYLDDIKAKDLQVMELCILAMHLVVSQSIMGTGGSEGRALLEGLDAIIAKFFPDKTAATNAANKAASGR